VTFVNDQNLHDGDAVVYRNGGGNSIGGLNDGQTYYVIRVDARTIKLAATLNDATAAVKHPIFLTTPGTGSSQGFQVPPATFDLAGLSMQLPAMTRGQIVSVTAAGAGGKTKSGAGAVSLNFVRENVDAHISSTGTGQSVTAAHDISVLANDASQVYS